MLDRLTTRILFKYAVMLAFAAFGMSPPAAADGTYRSYKDDAYVGAPTYYWGGLYIGIGVGYSFATTDLVHNYTGGLVGTDRYNVDQDGLNASASVGFDSQLSGSLVWGLFGDYTFGDIKDRVTLATPGNVDLRLRLGDSWAAGGRLGVLHDGALWYFAAGYTGMNVEFGGLGETLHGYFLGVGMEKDIHENFRMKIEYRFSDYSRETLFSASGCCSESVDIESSVHSVRLGLSYVLRHR